jgi:branched-chain amino acid transport system permease protein
MDMTKFTSKSFLVPWLVAIILLILLATSPIYGSAYLVVLLSGILMYVILTVSWAFFSGPTGYLSLAPAAFFGVGIYTSAILGKELPLLVVIGIGGLASFCLALLIGAVTLRLRGPYFAIFTLGLVELIRHFLLFWECTVTGTRGRFVVLVDSTTVFYIMLGIFVILMLTTYFIRRSKFGLAMQSIGEDEEAAVHAGVNVTMVKIITFAISAIFMGAAGAVMATRWTYIDPYIAFNPNYSFMPVLMAIFGGVGQIYGPILGAAIFAYIEEILLTRFPYHYMLIFGLILVLSIAYMPNGITGLIQTLRQKWQKGGLAGKQANN